MPRLFEMTGSSGINIHDSGAFQIGVEAFYDKVSPLRDYNQSLLEKEVKGSFTICTIFHLSAGLRGPEPESRYFRSHSPYRTDGLFRVRLYGKKKVWPGYPVLAIILKAYAEPTNQGGGGFTVVVKENIRLIEIEFQQAGSGNSASNMSNMELQMTGVFS